MTIPIQFTKIRADNIVTPASRYKNQPVIYWSDQNYITFTTYLRKPYVATGAENVMVINKGVEYRPDLVSQDVYGLPDNWWKILEANNMMDIMDFKSGTTIMLPTYIF